MLHLNCGVTGREFNAKRCFDSRITVDERIGADQFRSDSNQPHWEVLPMELHPDTRGKTKEAAILAVQESLGEKGLELRVTAPGPSLAIATAIHFGLTGRRLFTVDERTITFLAEDNTIVVQPPSGDANHEHAAYCSTVDNIDAEGDPHIGLAPCLEPL